MDRPVEIKAEESPLVEIFRHNVWANLRLLDACENLSEEQFQATVPGTFGTIRDTLMHIVLAERGYLSRTTGQPPAITLKRDEFPGIATLRESVRLSGEGLAQVAARARSTDIIGEEWQGRFYNIPVTIFLVQAINHATEHRTQVATILTQLGIEPPSIDGWAYMEP